jgi:hypothetical protein
MMKMMNWGLMGMINKGVQKRLNNCPFERLFGPPPEGPYPDPGGVLEKRRFQIKMKVFIFIVCSSFKRLFTNK